MRFSKWHGLGNDYLLAKRAELGVPLTPERVRKICDYHFGVGSDGILEVVSANGAEAEVVIWNPDGSTAELSGTERASPRAGSRAGAARTRSRSGSARARCARACADGAEVEMDIGAVEVGETETIDVGAETVEFTPVSVGNPHAVIRDDAFDRDDLLRLGPLVETHERFPERTNVQLMRIDGPPRRQRRSVGAGSGGDAFVRDELRGRRRRRGRQRLVRQPGDGPPGRRRPPRRARLPATPA